jgi:flagellar hook-length control protein FliK
MFTSAAAPSPNATLPGSAEGAPVSEETRAANAADFLALLGAAKAGTKKLAKVKATPLPAIVKPANAANGAADIKTALAEAPRPAHGAKITGKTTTEIKTEGEAGKTQIAAAVPAAILEALAATAKAKTPTPDIEAAAAETVSTPDDAARIKTKPVRPATRRDGETAAKPDIALKSPDAAADATRAAKAENHPAVQPVTPRPANSEAAAGTFTPQPASDALPQPLVADAQVTDTRIPLATREAAQAGFAAPVLAMRTISKDGVMKSIEIRLDPVELGQVDVKLETGHDGKLQAVVSAENADAFELLKKDSGALEAALREAGVDLGEGGLTFALNDSGADQSQQREAAYGGATARRAASAGELAASAALERSTWRDGVIDISV